MKQVINTGLLAAALLCGGAPASAGQSQSGPVAGPEHPASQRHATTDTRPATITGVVQSADDGSIENAVVVSKYGGQAVTRADGSFTLDVDVDAQATSIGLTAVAAVGSVNLTGNHLAHLTGRDQISDAGAIVLHANGDCEPAWVPTFGSSVLGVSSTVSVLTVFDDGSGGGPALYAGGYFTTAGGVEINRIAKWDGSSWSPLGSGMNGWVAALTVFDDGSGSGPALYAGGVFTTAGGVGANRIAKWDGSSWSPLGIGIGSGGGPNYVLTLTVFDDGSGGGPALYAGGVFFTAGGVEVNHISKWDGSSWSALSSGMNGAVSALTVFDDGSGGGPALYAGGWFTTAGGVEASRIAKWDGSSWSPLGSGVDNSVTALTVFDDGSGGGPALYAGGIFTTAGGVEVNFIAKWDGSSWSPLGLGMSGSYTRVSALTVFDDGGGGGPALYAGGRFTTAGDVEANRIAKWDGSSWSPLGSGASNVVYALTVFDDGGGGGPALHSGGDFTTAGGVTVNRIAKWDGASWSALGAGLNSAVFALTVFDDGAGGGPALYAGGWFTTDGGVELNRIAKWDGKSWSPLGTGMSSVVYALTAFDDANGGGPALYAGGWFTTAGGVTVNGIAKWDGSSWSPLGSGMNFWVEALAVFDDGSGGGPALYAGGWFTTAGGVTVNGIAKWDGSSWSPLGTGVSGGVRALTVFDDGSGGGPALYAGGLFDTAGGVEVNGIARWDGSSWSPLGSGMSNSVLVLTVFDNGSGGGPALYAGGWFTTAGGVTVNYIAKWDGASWSALGPGVNIAVFALTVFDDGSGGGPALYAGGDFTTAGGVEANRIARWDGASWSPLGSGMNHTVRALTVFDDGSGGGPALYAGGNFTVSPAGDFYLAKWQGCPTEPDCAFADLNCDGSVGVADLLILIASWGPCVDCDDCLADLTGDCAVGVSDLLVLLSNWG